MKIFFDTEFTGLHQLTTIVSIGCVSEDGNKFYAEFNDFDEEQIDSWLQDNIISKLKYYKKNKKNWYKSESLYEESDLSLTECYGDKDFIAKQLEKWLSQWDEVEMWSDCLAYDWVLFNNLWKHAFNIPLNVCYIPFDICTYFKICGVDPDINREEFAGCVDKSNNKHNSLWDAMVIRACYIRLKTGL